MKNRASQFFILLVFTITTYSFSSSAGNLGIYVVDTDTDPNFSFLKQDIKEGTIFKGLSDDIMNKEAFAEESKKPHFKKHADYFYEESKKIDAAFIKRIKDMINTKYAVRLYKEGTVKFCGGFHADYMITLKTETQKVDLQICYGCGDMRLFLDDVFIEEYDMNTEYAFKKWTAPYSDLGSTTE